MRSLNSLTFRQLVAALNDGPTGLLLLQGGRLLYATQRCAALLGCHCTLLGRKDGPCAASCEALRAAAAECERAGAEASRSLVIASATIDRRSSVEILLRTTVVDGELLVVGGTHEVSRPQQAVDALTRLDSRQALFQRLEALAASPSRLYAVLEVDLDGFKAINDAHGHAVGDRVLSVVARRLSWSVRATDTVGRLGGDEFVVLLPDLGSRQEAVAVATRIAAAVRRPLLLGPREFRVTCSAGLACHAPGVTALGLLARADAAMYAAKRAGGDGLRVSEGALREARPEQAARPAPVPRTGIAAIDAHHDRLIAEATAVVELSRGDLAGAELAQALERLRRSTRAHFLDEERVMATLGTCNAEAHQRAHRQLLAQLDESSDGCTHGSTGLVGLVDTLRDHLQTLDLDLATPAGDGEERARATAGRAGSPK